MATTKNFSKKLKTSRLFCQITMYQWFNIFKTSPNTSRLGLGIL